MSFHDDLRSLPTRWRVDGMVLGLALGTVLGLLFDNIGVGLALGLVAGLMLGWFDRRPGDRRGDDAREGSAGQPPRSPRE